MMRPLASVFLLASALGLPTPGSAQGLAGPERMILPMIQNSWIAFRNFGGHQLVYFTMLATYRCGLQEIRFSINSTALDQTFATPPCNPDMPNAIPGDFAPYLTLPPGTAEEIAVRVTFSDGTVSEMARYQPCPGLAEETCARYTPPPSRAGQF